MPFMNCLFWNIRGIGKGEKTMSIRTLVKNKNIAFLGLVETKHRKPFKPRLKRLWGNDEYDYCEVFASDTCSGESLLFGTNNLLLPQLHIWAAGGS